MSGIPLTSVPAGSSLHGPFLVNTLFTRQKILQGSGTGKTGFSPDPFLPCFPRFRSSRTREVLFSPVHPVLFSRRPEQKDRSHRSRKTGGPAYSRNLSGIRCSGDTLLSRPDKYFQADRSCSVSRQTGTHSVREQCRIIQRGYPSPVKGAGFRVPSRRRSQVQLLLHAYRYAGNAVVHISGSFRIPEFHEKDVSRAGDLSIVKKR